MDTVRPVLRHSFALVHTRGQPLHPGLGVPEHSWPLHQPYEHQGGVSLDVPMRMDDVWTGVWTIGIRVSIRMDTDRRTRGRSGIISPSVWTHVYARVDKSLSAQISRIRRVNAGVRTYGLFTYIIHCLSSAII